ncbi:MAG TPA: DNA primase [Dermatophilaceae bacterium]|nr:DNA primase [Dermatophilaceae bacterium]
MAGRIRAEDVTAVKERSSIEEVVRDHVTLRPAGVGSLKGLCPFHDEKTPSFTVRPTVGAYHCFGCGEGGDVISFVQKVDHLTFAEAVEHLAGRLGMELRYEEGTGGRGREEGGLGRRQRLLEAHRVAEQFYASALLDRPDARVGRDFLSSRGFHGAAAQRFGVGFAPRGGEELAAHLRGRGFTEEELLVAGLVGRGSRGLYDRFRGRLVWPIRDITGSTIGFGARRLLDEDRIAAKYLNTAETPVYKKSTVLYGLDLAKKAVATERTAVVVEGYTDVMAAHLAGVTTAVATCGTAFGAEHIALLRRIVRDEPGTAPARVVFTFDGDAAGQKAAMKAFEDDQRWASQSFAAVAADGMDPCDLRLARGDAAVRALVDGAVPMFEFAVRTTIARFDLGTAEGRISAMRAVAPIVASIRDTSLRPEYVRSVAGWLGLEVEQLRDAVARAPRTGGQRSPRAGSPPSAPGPQQAGDPGRPGEPDDPSAAPTLPRPDLRDPVVAQERQLLQALLQHPGRFPPGTVASLPADACLAPAHRAVLDGIRAVAGTDRGRSAASWTAAVADAAPEAVRGLVAELAVAPLPTRADRETGLPPQRYLDALVVGVQEAALSRQIRDATASVRRLQNDPESDRAALREHSLRLQDLERTRVRLRERLTT